MGVVFIRADPIQYSQGLELLQQHFHSVHRKALVFASLPFSKAAKERISFLFILIHQSIKKLM